MNLYKIASRNILRNWHRTVVTTLAMAFAGFIMILFAALMKGMLQTSERNAVTMDVGDIQIHAQGYREDPDLYKRIKTPEPLLQKLDQTGFLAAPRLYGFALAASGTTSSGVQLRGLNVEREKRVTQIHQHLLEGEWLSDEQSNGVVIGRKLARTLGVGLGDEVILVGQATDGSMANDLYSVRGILKSVGDAVDRGGFFMLENSFRDLMVLPEGSHEIAIMRPDRTIDLNKETEKIIAFAKGYEVLNWKQIRPVIARILEMADAQLWIMILITYIAVAMVVLNAMLMGVLERIHEFGIMKAIGVKPVQLLILIYFEAILQVFIASVLAVGFGWWASDYYQVHGIDLSNMATSTSFGGVAMDPIWYAYVTPDALYTPIIFLWGMTFIAVLYPAIKAAVTIPVKAIYYR